MIEGQWIIKPALFDRHGPLFKREDTNLASAMLIARNNGIQRRAKIMTSDLDKATEITAEAHKRFSKSLDALMSKEAEFVAASKRASSSVRDSANKLADGLSKLEKAANFDRLDRVVELLERAERALSSLAELNQSGKLDRISAAIK